ncbi:MAG: YdcF family protein [Thermoanaerobaculia bacterium]|nr:YdcF family protein [Thermoanaerobaculia bacterium]
MPRHVNDRWSDFLGPGALSSFLVATGVATLGLGLPILHRLRRVLRDARRIDDGTADAILVLGRVLEEDRPSRVFSARLDHGADLWRRARAPRILITGGLTGQATRTEAAAGRNYLEEQGFPEEAIWLEDRSRHTLENLSHVRDTLREEDWDRVLVVSDPLHQARIGALARGLNLECRFSPAREAAPESRIRWWLRALREASLLHWYHTGVLYSRLIGNETYLSRVR